jgi:hypothetical protein
MPDNPTDVIQDEELSARFTDFVARLRSVFTNKDLSARGSAAAVAMLVATRLDVIEGARAALEAADRHAQRIAVIEIDIARLRAALERNQGE